MRLLQSYRGLSYGVNLWLKSWPATIKSSPANSLLIHLLALNCCPSGLAVEDVLSENAARHFLFQFNLSH
jgi:hypothetical protein